MCTKLVLGSSQSKRKSFTPKSKVTTKNKKKKKKKQINNQQETDQK